MRAGGFYYYAIFVDREVWLREENPKFNICKHSNVLGKETISSRFCSMQINMLNQQYQHCSEHKIDKLIAHVQ